MNYIELINHFWKTRRKTRMTSVEADLYYFLMQESNIRGWENPFECHNGLIASTIGVTEKTMIGARRRLQQKGLIRFKPGQRKKKSPVYTLLPCNQEVQGTENKQPKPETKPSKKPVPTLKEVEDYCRERKNNVNAQNFIDFYTAKDWMIGKNKMKDWRAAVRTWENRKSNSKHPATEYLSKNLTDDNRW